jgi:hypothetical protein
MPQEIRVLSEGTLRWVQASGTGGWSTASAPASGLLGYVQAGFKFGQQEDFVPILDRGVPKHFKHVKQNVGKGQFKLLYGITADYPATAVTASGVSVPMVHLEWRANYTENGTGSGLYWQLRNVVFGNPQITENDNGDDGVWDFQYLSQCGPTASGFLG